MIKEVRLDLGTYPLSDLDKAKLNGVYASDMLQRFFQREGVELEAAEEAVDNGLEEEVEEENDDEQVD